jgi:ubiquinone/menaquinone biosynthesis C-methylase UbiE
MKKEVHEYWNARSEGEFPGSNDFNLKKIEVDTFLKELECLDFSTLLDVGCGGGETIADIQLKFPNAAYVGTDIGENMISSANKKEIRNTKFKVDSLPAMQNTDEKFDVVISERTLINLESYSEQLESIRRIDELLKPGGHYLMIENFNSGLLNINNARSNLGLDEIKPSWFNLYFDNNVLSDVEASSRLRVKKEVLFGGSYYFLSRAIYARLAEDEGKTPVYDSKINLLSAKYSLPDIGDFCPTKLVIWEKPL